MNLDDVLRCLAEADAGRLRTELCDGRYVVATYDEESIDDGDDEELEVEELDAYGVGSVLGLNGGVGSVLGEASSVYEALDLLASHFVVTGESSEELTEDDRDGVGERDYEHWLSPSNQHRGDVLREIHSPQRRILAYVLMGHICGPMDTVTANFWHNVYLGQTLTLFDGARFVFLTSAAPPNQELAFAIIECQPTGLATDVDRALVDGCRRGDSTTVAAAIAAGARVDALDERGMAPLHVAVAHRQLAVVAALLAAGADANLQSEYGNAPHFAALDRVQRVMPCARQIEDKNHWQILRTLLDAGADVNATSRRGATVMDLAIATVPYPREPLRFLVARSARGDLDGSSLGGLLDGLPAYSLRHLQVRVNKVRFLLEAGADPNQLHSSRFGREEKTALSLLFDSVGYKEDSVPGEIFLELVEELLRHGARDVPSSDGRTALDRAERWLEYGYENYRLAVERLREVASPSGR